MTEHLERHQTIPKLAVQVAGIDDAAVQHMRHLLEQDTEGEFRIGRQLGRGGMGVVYLATEIGLERQVALKVLPLAFTFGEGVERFRREAKLAASLDHPNIIPIYRISSGSELFWYTMRYLEGDTLAEYLQKNERCSLETTIAIMAQVADALDYAHGRGVVHRDIKPSNVMLDSNQRAMVTDFGIAKAASSTALTVSGAVVGTPSYMAPEQAEGVSVHGASDQYSLGIVAYRMLSGQVPFESPTPAGILVKHLTVDPPPLNELCPHLPVHVCQAVHRALAKTPGDRWPSLTAFVDALRPAADVGSAVVSASGAVHHGARRVTQPAPVEEYGRVWRTPEPKSRPRLNRRTRRVAAVTAVAAVGLMATVFMLTARAPTTSAVLEDLELDGVILTLPGEVEESPILGEAGLITERVTVTTLLVSGQDSITVPAVPGRPRQVYAATDYVQFGGGPVARGIMALGGLRLPGGTRIEVRTTDVPGAYLLRLGGTSTPITVTVTGSVSLAASGARDVVDFGAGGPAILVWPNSRRPLDLEFTPAEPVTLLRGVTVGHLELSRVEEDRRLQRTTAQRISTIRSGQLLIDGNSVPLGPSELLSFGSFAGVVRRLRLTDSSLVMSADGHEVAGVRTGSFGAGRDLMPKWLATLGSTVRVSLLGMVVLLVVGLLYSGVRLVKSVA